tara:strand:+ start:99 stop:713 length:615 start_codon:yes stop_codon:yes gene_type:complete
MLKRFLLLFALLTVFSCEDLLEDEPTMKLWLDGTEIDVEAEYQKITTYGEEVEYFNSGDSLWYTKKILVIHFQKDAGRVELNKEHYAVVFTDWEGDEENWQPIDAGEYQWPSVCPVCPRKCIHGAPSKWVRMEIPGDGDISISGTAHIDEVAEWDDGSWTITGTGEGTFYNPFVQANMSGKIEFTDLEVSTDKEESPYHDYGGR